MKQDQFKKADELLSKMPRGNAKIHCINNINLSQSPERKKFWKSVLLVLNNY